MLDHIRIIFVILIAPAEELQSPLDSEYFPKDVVQHVINNVRDTAHKSHSVFCQLDTLKKYIDWEWRETAR